MIAALLLTEFEEEAKKTRAMLERVPMVADFKPPAKSMPLSKLAPHVAELPGFGHTILATPELDFSAGPPRVRPAFESPEQLVKAFDEGAAKIKAALRSTSDAAWNEPWKLSFQGKTIFSGSRFLAYRQMFMNHLVHHRAADGSLSAAERCATPGDLWAVGG